MQEPLEPGNRMPCAISQSLLVLCINITIVTAYLLPQSKEQAFDCSWVSLS